MDLFSPDPAANLLPRDGTVHYLGPVLNPAETDRYFQSLLNEVPWKSDELVLFGKRIVTARKVAWFGDSGLDYSYSGTTKQPHPWTPQLAALKALAEDRTGSSYNSCLLNLYHHGDEGMGWHSDDEKSIVRHSAIASISFGAEREFRFKHKATGEKVSILLESGSLLVMKDATQSHWQHAIPKTRKVTSPRVNLTFRSMVRSPDLEKS